MAPLEAAKMAGLVILAVLILFLAIIGFEKATDNWPPWLTFAAFLLLMFIGMFFAGLFCPDCKGVG